MYLDRRAGFAGMAQDAVFHRPGNFAVVACTAVLSFYDLVHVDVIAASLELETEVGMAHFATEANSVEPVRKNHRAHARGIRVIIDHDVAVLGHRRCRIDKDSDYRQRPDKQHSNYEFGTDRCPENNFSYQGWHLLPFLFY